MLFTMTFYKIETEYYIQLVEKKLSKYPGKIIFPFVMNSTFFISFLFGYIYQY